MKLVLQRVSRATVKVADQNYEAGIGPGLLILAGLARGDGEAQVRTLAEKAASLRIFKDDQGKMNLSVLEIGGEALVVSQFTLLGNCAKGRRPSFEAAELPEFAKPLYESFCAALESQGLKKVARGIFGASMEVSLVNDGPVTFVLDA